MPELRVDVSDLKSESSNLIKELAVFLEEKRHRTQSHSQNPQKAVTT